MVSSHLGAIRGGIAHNGTDIVPPSVMYSLIAPSQGIVIGTQTGFANGVTQTKGNAQRGNFVFVYYGESSSGGVFVLYQHLSPGFSWKIGDTIPAGVDAQTLSRQKSLENSATREYEQVRRNLNDALLRLEILTHTPIINKPISMPGVSKEAPETE